MAAGELKKLWKSHEGPPVKDKIMKNIHRWSRRPSRTPDQQCEEVERIKNYFSRKNLT